MKGGRKEGSKLLAPSLDLYFSRALSFRKRHTLSNEHIVKEVTYALTGTAASPAWASHHSPWLPEAVLDVGNDVTLGNFHLCTAGWSRGRVSRGNRLKQSQAAADHKQITVTCGATGKWVTLIFNRSALLRSTRFFCGPRASLKSCRGKIKQLNICSSGSRYAGVS